MRCGESGNTAKGTRIKTRRPLSIGREKRASRTKRTEGRVRHTATQRTRILPRDISRPRLRVPLFRASRAPPPFAPPPAELPPSLSRAKIPQPPCGPEIFFAGPTEINENSSTSLTKRKHNSRNCGSMQSATVAAQRIKIPAGNKGPLIYLMIYALTSNPPRGTPLILYLTFHSTNRSNRINHSPNNSGYSINR